MLCKNSIFVIAFFILSNCTTGNLTNNKPNTVIKNTYSNKGFTITYNEYLYKEKKISNKL